MGHLPSNVLCPDLVHYYVGAMIKCMDFGIKTNLKLTLDSITL